LRASGSGPNRRLQWFSIPNEGVETDLGCFLFRFEKLAGKNLLRKEVIHRQLPLPMPCYDLAPVMILTLFLGTRLSGTNHFHGLTGGVYKTRERIHRDEADSRLLAIPAS
jgi:hypothetical protein